MENETKILLVEDDAATRRMLREPLVGAGYRVLEAEGQEVGLNLFRTQKPDLVVLDLNLMDGDGIEVCRQIRAHKTLSDTPVIMLTIKGKIDEKAAGFGVGADQYLAKPVLPQELLLWVKALLRRMSFNKEEGPLRVAGLTIDPENRQVRYEDAALRLTRKELELLYYLVKERPKVLSRKQILSGLWESVADEKVVDYHVGNLRAKLPPKVAAKLETVVGKGFRFLE